MESGFATQIEYDFGEAFVKPKQKATDAGSNVQDPKEESQREGAQQQDDGTDGGTDTIRDRMKKFEYTDDQFQQAVRTAFQNRRFWNGSCRIIRPKKWNCQGSCSCKINMKKERRGKDCKGICTTRSRYL